MPVTDRSIRSQKNMRSKIVFLSVLLLAGCTSIPIPADFASEMSAAAERYRTVKSEMTKQEAVALLGAPRREEERLAVWEVRYDARNYDSLTVAFDASGRITTLTRKHSRWSAGIVAHGRAYQVTN
jgi:hypothetical protein